MISWDWIAGFTLADGHVQWVEGKKGGKQGIGGRIILAQKAKEPLEAIEEFLIIRGIEDARLYLRPKSKGYRRGGPVWILSITSRNSVIEFLEQTYQLLFHKRDRAEFVLKELRRLNEERKLIVEQALALRERNLSWREIARHLDIHRTALTSFFREEGINIKDDREGLDAKTWRHDRIERGLCYSCGQPRGLNGTKWKCRPCADYSNRKARERAAKAKEQGLCRRCFKPRENLNSPICNTCREYARDYKRRKVAQSNIEKRRQLSNSI